MTRTKRHAEEVTLARLEEGEHLERSPNQPILSLVVDGRRSYLWIGNDAEGDSACFAIVKGEPTLRRIAESILAALPARRRQ